MPTNYPGSLDTGTTLNNTRATGDTGVASDHDTVANALIAVETKLGAVASTPTTSGNVLTATGAGTSTWQAPATYTLPSATSSVIGGVQLTGDLTGTASSPALAAVGTAGTYGSSSLVPIITTDTKGRVTSVSTATVTGGGGGTTTYYNVKSYGAQGNGSNDDTSSIQAAINAALGSSRGTGAVYFPAGTYKITSTLHCSSATGSAAGKGVHLVGDGREASQIFQNSSFIGVDWLGNGGPAGNPTAYGGLRNITINGNAGTGAAVRVVAGQQMEFNSFSIIGKNDVALDLQCTQDSYFFDATFNNCGSTSKRVIEIYGDAYGTANMLWFSQIRVETFLKGAVTIYRGAGATGGGNNGFFFSQCKFENYPTIAGDIIWADSYTQQLQMSQIFISFGQYNSGYSTPANGIVFGDGGASPGFNQAAFRDIFMNTGPTTNIGASVVRINANTSLSGAITIDNVFCDATLANGVVNITGASNCDIKLSQVTGQGTLIAGDNTAHAGNAGTGTFASGTATINTPLAITGARITVTPTSTSAAAGIPYIQSITSGTSFTVKSSNASDANTFNWVITN